MPALHRAVALEQMDAAAVRIREHLELDVPRLGQIFFQEHAIVAEARLRLAPCRAERSVERIVTLDDAHPLAPATGPRLDQNRVTDRVRLREQARVLLVGSVITGHDRHSGFGHDRLGLRFRAHRADRRRRRPDEDESGRGNRSREVRVLGQEAVAGMDGLGTARAGRGDDRLALEIARPRRRGAHPIRFITRGHVQRGRVGVRIYGDGANTHAPRRTCDPARDLAPVRDEDLVKHRAGVAIPAVRAHPHDRTSAGCAPRKRA